MEGLGQFYVLPRTGVATPLASGLVEKVGVSVFDAACRRQVVVGDWKAVGVWVVDGGSVAIYQDAGVQIPLRRK